VDINPVYDTRLAHRYRIRVVPAFVMLTPDGAGFDSFVGTTDMTSFVGWLDRAEQKWRRPNTAAVAQLP